MGVTTVKLSLDREYPQDQKENFSSPMLFISWNTYKRLMVGYNHERV